MGVAWNEFPLEVRNIIHKQLGARFGDMIPKGNQFMQPTIFTYSRNL
jgi:hypothetical protein